VVRWAGSLSQRARPRWGGGSDRAEDDLRKEGGGEEVKAARMELVVHGRVGVWRRESKVKVGRGRKTPRGRVRSHVNWLLTAE